MGSLCWAEGTTTICHAVNSWTKQWCSAPLLKWSYNGSLLDWVPRWKESLFMKKIVLVATTTTQEKTSNTFYSCIIKPFQGYCLYLTTKKITQMHTVQKRLYEIHSFGQKWLRGKRRNESDLFRRYKGDNYRSLLQTHWFSSLFSQLCWQNYLDSQRFYIKSIGSDWTSKIQQVLFVTFDVSVWSLKCLFSF